jgi:MFS family permease
MQPIEKDDLSASRMTNQERRSSVSLAAIFALRMLGLFIVLPVFALEAQKYPGGDDPVWVGVAMGIYGLTQSLLQIPFGMAADAWGRKRVMVAGLLIFALGSAVAAWAPTLTWLVVGRALQGAGAISAAVTALLADQTRDAVRTKAMALVGASIGLMFALSLVLAPVLASQVGLSGVFVFTTGLALTAIAVVLWWVPAETAQPVRPVPGALRAALTHPMLLRLHLGVFVLHAVQLSMWMAVPALLVAAGLAQDAHWQIYLPAVLASFVVMGATLFPLERRGYVRAVFLVAIGLLLLVQLALWWLAQRTPSVWALGLILFVFFCGFNVLEASQPSLVSKWAPGALRATTLGVYNSLQSLGLFVGGWLGGWIVKQWGAVGLFGVCGASLCVWLLIAWPMRAPKAA